MCCATTKPPAWAGRLYIEKSSKAQPPRWLRAAVVASLCLASPPDAASAAAPDFARDVRPILEKNCFGCHGPEKQKSGYRLDVREIALKGGDSGNAAIVPHDAKHSPLVRFVSGEDEEILMPPKKGDAQQLKPEQIATLRAWIDAGAAWPEEFAGPKDAGQPHWSLRPLAKPAVPAGEKHPIDAFIQAKLTAKKLTPSPEADRRTLIRRLYYDLTGLPPTPEEVDAFLADTDARAYEKLVARLLASPRHGERWARHWLDAVHYADTHGNDHDYARPNAWPYRDYVIRSLNEDKPYARFVQEQVAGDALFPDEPEATVALGFLAAGPWDDTLMVTVREDTVDHRMAQVLDRDNMVSTVMSTFQSLTVHCARCHDHKFDPVSQREYYGLQAVFAGVDRADRPFDTDAAVHVQRRALLARKGAIARRDAALLASLETPETAAKIAIASAALAERVDAWQPLEIVSVTSASGVAGTTFARQSDGSWFVSGTRPDKDAFIVTAQTRLQGIRALRLEVLPDERLPKRGPGRWDNGNFHLSEVRAEVQPSSGETRGAERVKFAKAAADHEGDGQSIAGLIDGKVETYWSVDPRYGEAHEAVFELTNAVGFAVGSTFIIRLEHQELKGHQIGRFRLSIATNALAADLRKPVPAAVAALLRLPEAERTRDQRRDLALHVLAADIERELAALPAPRFVYAATREFTLSGSFKPTAQPRPIHLLTRGDIGRPADLIGPAALGCVPGLPREFALADANDEAVRRAALARWLVDDRNVLAWRSIVNRVWHYHFGRGLVDTPNDFGKMGSAPSHPELLDWLAVWFRDEAKGSLKALHQLIVTSETWKQGSGELRVGSAELETQRRNSSDSTLNTLHSPLHPDDENRFLSHAIRRRLTAEEVRDTMLALSGQLDLTMGGPPAIQFIHRDKATFNTDGAPAFLDYEHFDPDSPAARRRAVYRFLFRTVPDPLMDALDCPDGGTMTPVRSASTTALQALAMLNDNFLIRQCDHLAARLARSAETPEAQVSELFRHMLQRRPTAHELTTLAAFTRRQGLANTCHLLMNSNEFMHLD